MAVVVNPGLDRSELSCYGKLFTPIRKIHMGSKAPELRNSKIVSFRRLVYMVLNNGVEELDLAMKFGVDGFDYMAFVSTDSGMKCFNCGEAGHLVRACTEKVKMDGATDRQVEQTRPKVCSSDTEGDGPSVSGSPVAESVPADPPAAASSMLDPVMTVPPAVEIRLSGGNPGATVAKPAGDKAGTSDPAKSDKEMSEPTSEPPVQISQVDELESSLDVDFKDNGDSDTEIVAEPVFKVPTKRKKKSRSSQLLNLLSVSRLITILDEADDCSVVRELQELDRWISGGAVIGVKGEEQWGEDATLGAPVLVVRLFDLNFPSFTS
ncbi:hypothetical protein QTP86_015764 [Hemibagrus guttatus]|nr:hypothetical protein QTP86_015764 [Hemibagrus guttatus]